MARSHILVAQANGNWDAANQWQDTGDSLYYTPGNGDECRVNGKAVALNLARIPASGTLTEMNSKDAAGALTSGSYTVDLTSQSVDVWATYLIAGSGSRIMPVTGGTNTLTIHGSVISAAGNGVYSIGVNYNLVITGDVQAGATMAILYRNGNGNITINGNVSGGSGSGAYGV